MIPANRITVAELAYSLAIEKAEDFVRLYRRLAFWVPFWGQEFQMKAKIWECELDRLKHHAQFIGTGAKSRKQLPEIVDVRIPARIDNYW